MRCAATALGIAVAVIDDGAVGGFLASFLRGESPEMALKYAVATGAQNVTQLDATSGLRSLDETQTMMNTLPVADLVISVDGWVFDSSLGMWRGPAVESTP